MRRVAAGAPALVLTLLAACASDGSAPAPPPPRPTRTVHAAVTATPARTRAWDPLVLRARGLPPGERATLVVTAPDSAHGPFRSETTFVVGTDGTLDTSRDVPVRGGYRHPDATGPLTAMEGAAPGGMVDMYRRAVPFRAEVQVDGASVGATTFERGGIDVPPATVRLTPARNGFTGVAAGAAGAARRRPAVLLLGGSEGGLATEPLAVYLAQRGIPALAVCYFACDDGRSPATLRRISVERLAAALDWLRAQPGVDPARVTVLGWSRGGEAAQLLGIHRPEEVHQVVMLAGNYVSWPAYDPQAPDWATTPAWTVDGGAVPFTADHLKGSPAPLGAPGALQTQRFPGRVVVACGGYDIFLDACWNADRIAEQRPGLPTLVLRYPDAGHGLIGVVPHLAGAAGTYSFLYGDPGRRGGESEWAREQLAPRLVNLLLGRE